MLPMLRIIVTIVAAPFLVVAYLNIEVLANSLGWDIVLLDRYPAMADLLTRPWVFALAAFIVGVSFGLWTHYFATKVDRKRKQQPPDLAKKTHLRLQFGRDVTPFQVINENVWRWYSMKFIAVLPDASKRTQVTQIFIVFDAPGSVRFVRASCSNPDRQLQVQDMTDRSAVILADGDLADTTVDMVFSEVPV
jgi:hypothetical protein